MLFVFFVSLLILFLEFILCNRCCQISLKDSPGYVLVKNNAWSLKSIIARKVALNVEKCKEFAESKKALAFNYGRENFTDADSMEDYLYNTDCVVLDCPEMQNFTALQNRTGIKYYTSYPYRSWANNNSTNSNVSPSCVPGVGLFMFSEDRLNFTDARLVCQKLNGSLAHIVSEERTQGLAAFIRDSPIYVGLSNQGKERKWKNEFGEPLECFDYRAWSEGEPSHSRGCVVLVRPGPKAIPIWRVSPCGNKYSYACEISPAKYRKHHQKNKKSRH